MAASDQRGADTGREREAAAAYSLGRSAGESARLSRQADELAADSAALLDRVGVQAGQSAIDLGCGPRGIIDLLAARTGPAGRVVGLDADPVHAALASAFAADRGLRNVQVVTADARHTGLPSESFDVVHCRTLLVNIPAAAEAVAEMVRLARPGGWLAAMEPDSEYWMCYPPHPAFTRISEIYPIVFARNGADPTIGRKLPELFWEAGLAHVGMEASVQVYPPGHSRRTIRLDVLRSMRAQAVEMGLASEAELDELDASARAHLDDPRTVAAFGHLFRTWGQKPA